MDDVVVRDVGKQAQSAAPAAPLSPRARAAAAKAALPPEIFGVTRASTSASKLREGGVGHKPPITVLDLAWNHLRAPIANLEGVWALQSLEVRSAARSTSGRGFDRQRTDGWCAQANGLEDQDQHQHQHQL